MAKFDLIVTRQVLNVYREEVLRDFELPDYPLPDEVVEWRGALNVPTRYFKVTARRWVVGPRGASVEIRATDITAQPAGPAS